MRTIIGLSRVEFSIIDPRSVRTRSEPGTPARGISMPQNRPAWQCSKLSFLPEDRRCPPRVVAQIQIPCGISIESAACFEMPDWQAVHDQWGREIRCDVLRVPGARIHAIEGSACVQPGLS